MKHLCKDNVNLQGLCKKLENGSFNLFVSSLYYYICSLSFLSKDSYDHLKMVIKLNLD